MSQFRVRKAAVLGAGVMGAQIAAHLVNLKVPVVLFDLPAKEGAKNSIALNAIENLKNLKPAPLALETNAQYITPANYDEHMDLLGECDLIIEAIAERMDWKTALYQNIAPHIAPHAIVASNTSGLSIAALSQALPESIRPRFCGIHFFNPPRYMYLVELIAAPNTQPKILDDLETFVTSSLGKGVVRAKDTPNFIANRVGIAGIVSTMIEAEKRHLTFDAVDDLTGRKLGRASSGTYRTTDVVGLDTMAHVIKTMQDTLSLEIDPFYASFATPAILQQLIEKGHLGQKSKAGYFKKDGRNILRFDPQTSDYVAAEAKASAACVEILKKPAAERLKLLHASDDVHAQFIWAVLRNSFHYAAVHLQAVADTARDVDFALRWGFGMQQGPFELWQAAGWPEIAKLVQADIDAGKALCHAPLPAWVFEGAVAQRGGVHQAEGSWNPTTQQFEPRSKLPVYQRQYFPENVLGSQATTPLQAGTTVEETPALRLWTLDNHVLIASIKTKNCIITPQVCTDLTQAVALAESQFQALVIWSPNGFSHGTDIAAIAAAVDAGGNAASTIHTTQQQLMQRIHYAQVPIVAAIHGNALGVGCELALHCSARVLTMESRMGLTDIHAGLLPSAGALTYIAKNAAANHLRTPHTDMASWLSTPFTACVHATTSRNALEARTLGYAQDTDPIVPNKDELLYVAIAHAQALHTICWRAPLAAPFLAAGQAAAKQLLKPLSSLQDNGSISAYDMTIAQHIAHVLTGGDVASNTLLAEAQIMQLERIAFAELLAQPQTQARMAHLLKTGKPLTN